MKKHLLRFALLVSAAFSAVSVRAQETVTQATILAVTGSATVKLPDGASVAAKVGLVLPQGTAIVTEKNAQVSIQAHEGMIAVVAGASSVEIEKLSVSANGTRNALLNVKSGHLASSLDPSRKKTNNYGVRTAKGVTMAHGTDFVVTVDGVNFTVTVLVGGVTVNWTGGASVSVVGSTPLSSTSNGQPAISLAAAMNMSGITQALEAAAAAAATGPTANMTQINAVIGAIATAAGTSPTASNLVAGVTAAAVGAAVTNTTLVAAAGNGGSIAVASTISTAAVAAAKAAGNGSAAEVILVSAGNAVVDSTGAALNTVAKALTDASNSAGNPTVKAAEVISGVNAPENKGTPVTPIDPSINVSPSA